LTKLQFADGIPFSLSHVFAFFSNPENLPRPMTAATMTRIDRLDLVRRSVRRLPVRAQWVTRITEFEWNHHFADVQQKGPFKHWHHRHEFLAETLQGVSGTLVRDLIEYEVGLGLLGHPGELNLYSAANAKHSRAASKNASPVSRLNETHCRFCLKKNGEIFTQDRTVIARLPCSHFTGSTNTAVP
jgi:ligand-binding SRPBCC domain-containing protein